MHLQQRGSLGRRTSRGERHPLTSQQWYCEAAQFKEYTAHQTSIVLVYLDVRFRLLSLFLFLFSFQLMESSADKLPPREGDRIHANYLPFPVLGGRVPSETVLGLSSPANVLSSTLSHSVVRCAVTWAEENGSSGVAGGAWERRGRTQSWGHLHPKHAPRPLLPRSSGTRPGTSGRQVKESHKRRVIHCA